MSTIEVMLEGRPWQLPAGSTLAELVRAAGHAQADVATAVNGEFVPRERRASCPLAERDDVLLFQPIVGG